MTKPSTKDIYGNETPLADDWRYHAVDEWRFDSIASKTNQPVEDEMASLLDGEEETEPTFNAVRVAQSILSTRHFNVLYWHLWEGETFAQIAERLGVNRARAHQLYKYALNKLRPILAKHKDSN